MLDIVYFNFNDIYGKHESLWLSSTWPIKVLMQGDIDFKGAELWYTSKAQFQIADTVMEYVQSILRMNLNKGHFVRNTDIKTSRDAIWHLHMLENAIKLD
ncbi:hypothetical protein [Flagellimonas meishanensis]|uniref:hypothetical protein n=1 Tax=Flagellimonas meishanensis TaxID=2873264 RepID=UPI001CA621FB|nr:hypothetical protein [[Muricauda] meishanensis]